MGRWERVGRWWKPDATVAPADDHGNLRLPPLIVSPTTVWRLGESMASEMGGPVVVAVPDGAESYRAIGSPSELAEMGAVENLRLMAGPGISLHEGRLRSDGRPAMHFEFPSGRAGYTSMSGSAPRLAPYRERVTELAHWLVSQGRYRSGWVPVIRLGGAVLTVVLLAGLVATLLIALDEPYAGVGVPFVGLTGVAAVWGAVKGTRKLSASERARVRGVVVRQLT